MILNSTFLDTYPSFPDNFGFGEISKFVFETKYSLLKPDNTKETWKETITRVVEGLFWILNEYKPNRVESDEQRIWATEMFDLMFNMK